MSETIRLMPEPNALRRYELLSAHTRDIMLFIRPDGQIVEANRAAEEAYGYPRHELLQKNLRDLTCPVSAGPVSELLTTVQHSGVTFELQQQRSDGTIFPVEINCSPSEIGGVLIGVARDITQRKQAEATHALLREIDRMILQRHPLPEILRTICDRLVSLFGHALAWIGLKQPDGSVGVVTYSGPASSFLDGIIIRWDESPEGLGPTGTAMRTGVPQLFQPGDLAAAPRRDRYGLHALQSALSIPLNAEGQIVGALSLYSTSANAFEEEIGHLLGFADQVAISLLAAQDQEQIRLQTAALEAAANAVVITARDGHIRWVNKAWTTLTGYSREETIGQTSSTLQNCDMHDQELYQQVWETLKTGQIWHGELHNRRKDGSIYIEEQTITPVCAADGAITHFVAVKQDISDRKQQEERQRYLATHDPATDLPNRRLLTQTLQQVLSQTSPEHTGAFLLLDLDDFKRVNHAFGYSAGDRLLIDVASVLRQALRPSDLLARWGGDEFAVLLGNATAAEALSLADQLRHAVDSALFQLGEHELHLQVSIGIAAVDLAMEAEAVVASADAALYAAKGEGKNQIAVGSYK